MKKVLFILGVVLFLFLAGMDAFGRQTVVGQINPFFTGGQHQITARELPTGNTFQVIDDFVDSYEDFKLAILRHFRAKDSEFTISFQVGSINVNAWWNQVDKDQDAPWLTHSWYAASYPGGLVSMATFSVDYWHMGSQEVQLESVLRDKVRKLINSGMDLPAREKAIHDWVVQHVTYDQTLQKHSDYHAFFEGSAVCQGYTLLTSRMLAMAGVENRIVTGTTANGGNHAWNMVNLCGSWFQLDTTFDDPIGMPANYLLYNYFNVTDQQLSADHSWIWSDYPACQTAYIDGSCQEVTGCSIFTPSWCNDEFQCINVSGTWKDGVCTVPGSDSGEEDTGDAELAAPLQDMVAMTFGTDQVYPEFTRVNVAAGPVRLQPKLVVDVRDRGKPADLFVYIYLPGSKGGFNFSGPRVVLDDEADFAPVFPDVLDFSRQSNLIFYVYYGYVLADGTIRYNAYEVLVDVLFW